MKIIPATLSIQIKNLLNVKMKSTNFASGKRLNITTLSIILFSIGCSSFQTKPEQWEGISRDTLSITIYEFMLFDENADNISIKNQLMDKLNQRATLILASELSIELTKEKVSKTSDEIMNNLINDIVRGGKFINYECNENNYCSANSVYNIEELNKFLNSNK